MLPGTTRNLTSLGRRVRKDTGSLACRSFVVATGTEDPTTCPIFEPEDERPLSQQF